MELTDGADASACASDAVPIDEVGETTEAYEFSACGETISSRRPAGGLGGRGLEPVFPYRAGGDAVRAGVASASGGGAYHARAPDDASRRPRVVIPVFPGNNCEYDSAPPSSGPALCVTRYVVNNLTPDKVAEIHRRVGASYPRAQIVMMPGGFSGGDEPDGSAKFITAFFRAPDVTEAVRDLLQNRDGLMLGICNGFQALVKLGLVPFGDIRPWTTIAPRSRSTTSAAIRARSCVRAWRSTMSPWIAAGSGRVHTVPSATARAASWRARICWIACCGRGQIATQYVDAAGRPSMDLAVNPNGSACAIEGITSPDGRVFGKMGHSERRGAGLYQNVLGDLFQPLFEGGVGYFTD